MTTPTEALAQQPSAEPMKGWKLNHTRKGPEDGMAEIGYLDPEDDHFSPIVTVDTDLYYQADQAMPLAVAILGAIAGAAPQQTAPQAPTVQPLTDWQIEALQGLDTASRVRFYEHDFYVLSNFSAFRLEWEGEIFDTSEAAYHAEKFWGYGPVHANWDLIRTIREAPSAHEAFKIAERNKALRRPDWDAVKVGIMKRILRAKADQHEYVRRKLMATGNRELVEDSWRDDFWGWGPDRKGQNMLGRLWMEVRAELAGITAAPTKETP